LQALVDAIKDAGAAGKAATGVIFSHLPAGVIETACFLLCPLMFVFFRICSKDVCRNLRI
jgi:hypothetical protein